MPRSDRRDGRRGACAVLLTGTLLLATSPALAIDLPGTQPGELTQDFRAPFVCGNCHGGFSDNAPNDVWQGSMMANAMRDPIFQAALTIANQDVPGAGDLCLRCHTPRGWLSGRSEPTDGSALEPDDYEGVDCDFCHRLTDGPDGEHLIGNAQYFVADDYVRRGTIIDAQAPHDTLYDPYFADSALCGLCHDVSNPLEGGFAIERTFTEWTQSSFATEGRSCQSCHMPAVQDQAAGSRGAPERTVHRHELVGGNAWVPRVLAGEYPHLGRQAAYEYTAQRAVEMLQSAAQLELQLPDVAPRASDALRFTVRVENLTGHKLPTGYPEGRRCWLEVRVVDADAQVLFESGRYDADSAERLEDAQLRTYEVKMADDGVEGFHFMLQNELVQDNRIPPRGFRPDAQTAPMGRDYLVLPDGALAHWDEAPYTLTVPGNARGPLRVEVRLWYQTISREYIEFLRDENRTDERGNELYALWQQYDQAPPVLMAEQVASLMVRGEPGEDADTLEPEPPGAGDGSEDCCTQVRAGDTRRARWPLGVASAWVTLLVLLGRRRG